MMRVVQSLDHGLSHHAGAAGAAIQSGKRPHFEDGRNAASFLAQQSSPGVDEFDFRHWAKQALGPTGNLVAVLPPLRKKARAQARGQLDAFVATEKDKGSA